MYLKKFVTVFETVLKKSGFNDKFCYVRHNGSTKENRVIKGRENAILFGLIHKSKRKNKLWKSFFNVKEKLSQKPSVLKNIQ